MVGRGFLKPDMEKLRTDTPKALRRLLENCLSYTRDGRPAFRNVRSCQIFSNLSPDSVSLCVVFPRSQIIFEKKVLSQYFKNESELKEM